MKKLLFILSIACVTVCSRCKEDDPLAHLSADDLETKQKTEACYASKVFPNSSVGVAYVEGEIDGKFFRITSGQDDFTALSAMSVFYNTPDSAMAQIRESGIQFISMVYSFGLNGFELQDKNPHKNFSFQLVFPAFSKDSNLIDYLKRFERVGESFPIGDIITVEDQNKKRLSHFQFFIRLSGCSGPPVYRIYLLTSNGSQKNGFLRLADYKKVTAQNGTVIRRIATYEFELDLYTVNKLSPFKRLNKGKMVLVF